MGGGSGPKNVHWDDIKNVGSGIERETKPHLQEALNQATDAAEVKIANYTAVEHWYASSYILAVQFVRQSFDTKIDDAAKVKDHLHHLADDWKTNEDNNTYGKH